uniref:Methyltranfer_dom domain-containing protein n=1 Tax=Macrostomum lignano TaxID=282301 RepID=A0A1I8GUA0_9PLAT
MLCACSAGSLPQLRHALNTCLSVVQLFSGVVDSYVSDYFVADLKQLVKPCLFYHLNESCPPCLANIIVPLDSQKVPVIKCFNTDHGSPCVNRRSPAPLLLQSLRQLTRLYQLNCPAEGAMSTGWLPLLSRTVCPACEQLRLAVFDDEPASPASLPATARKPQLKPALRKKVKLKKEHEICSLGNVISWLHQRVHQPELEPLVVDAGSGLGHLSRHLSVELGLPVLAIEGASHHGPAAAELDLRAQRLHRVQSAASGCTPQHRCQVLQSGADLLAQCPADRPLLLTGLHACGDLSSLLVRALIEDASPPVLGLASVGCCYMRSVASGSSCFPMRAGASDQLSYQALELACHSLLAFARRLRLPDEIGRLRAHAYRAGLQLLLLGDRVASAAGDSVSSANPAGDSVSSATPAGHNVTTPAVDNVATPAVDNVATPAVDNVTAPAGDNVTTPAGDNVTAPAGDNVTTPAVDNVTAPASGTVSPSTSRKRFPVKKLCRQSFRDYALSVSSRPISADESEWVRVEQLVNTRWREVLTWNCLRLLLAPLAESAVLLDRMIYLRESRADLAQLALLPLFDPEQSPRNVCIIAVKK